MSIEQTSLYSCFLPLVQIIYKMPYESFVKERKIKHALGVSMGLQKRRLVFMTPGQDNIKTSTARKLNTPPSTQKILVARKSEQEGPPQVTSNENHLPSNHN